MKIKNISKSLAMMAFGPATVMAAGKSQVGIDHLTLDEFPKQNVTVCSTEGASSIGGILPDQLTIAVDPFSSASMKLSFSVGDVLSTSLPKDYVLALAVSKLKSSSPAIVTPKSSIDLGIDLSDLEILGLYSIPQAKQKQQEMTRFGQGIPSGRIKFSFDVNLHTDKIVDLIRGDQNSVYVQALIVSEDAFKAGDFSTAILSEVDHLKFIKNNCENAGLTIKAGNNGEIDTIVKSETSGDVVTKTSSSTKTSQGIQTKTVK